MSRLGPIREEISEGTPVDILSEISGSENRPLQRTSRIEESVFKTGKVVKSKTELLTLKEKHKKRFLKSLYEGNEWDRPLGQHEWFILYFILKQISFLIDWVFYRGQNSVRG